MQAQILAADTGEACLRLGQKQVPGLRPDWEAMQVDVMCVADSLFRLGSAEHVLTGQSIVVSAEHHVILPNRRYAANLAKFTQHSRLRELLLRTRDPDEEESKRAGPSDKVRMPLCNVRLCARCPLQVVVVKRCIAT